MCIECGKEGSRASVAPDETCNATHHHRGAFLLCSCPPGRPSGFCTLSHLPKHAAPSRWVLGSAWGILCRHTQFQTESLCFCPSHEATYSSALFSESPLDSTSQGSSRGSFIPHWPWQCRYADILIFAVYSPLFYFLVVIIFCKQETNKYIQFFITSRL